MSLNLGIPENLNFKPRILVFGAGGAGGNALNNMIKSELQGVEFIAANTDSQALTKSLADNKIQLGKKLTSGLGAGASPQIGKEAAEESAEEINSYLDNCHMAFITCGMGGGTGTGAAPVIARIAKERGVLTVGVITKPFNFEGPHRTRISELGIEALQEEVDTLIIIPNQNLFRIASEKTTFSEAFKMADDVLHSGVKSVTDLIVQEGLINLDFADIKTIMNEMGRAMMGMGESDADNRAIVAAESAISNPLLDNTSMKGAKGVLINITGGNDMTLFEVDEAVNRVRNEIDMESANIIFGSTFDPNLEGKIRVSVIATGLDSDNYENQEISAHKMNNKKSNSTKSLDMFRITPKENLSPLVKEKTPNAEKKNFSTKGNQVKSENYRKERDQSDFFSIASDSEKQNKQTNKNDTQDFAYQNAVTSNNLNTERLEEFKSDLDLLIIKEDKMPKKKHSYFEIPAFLRRNKDK